MHKISKFRLLMLFVVLGMFATRVSAAPTLQDGYPAPETEINPQNNGVVNPDSVAYPKPATESSGIMAPIVGAQQTDAAGQPVPAVFPPQQPAESGSGLGFLWVGFIAGLLIFATAVVGSLILFARTTEVSGNGR